MLINGSMLLGGIFIIVVGFAMIVLLLILIYAFIDIVSELDSRLFGGFFLNKEQKLRRDEYLTILEMQINREEALKRGEKYVADPRGIRWRYHELDKDGKIIKKY